MPARSRLWPDPRVKPPYGAVEIDWSHPLAAGLASAWLFADGGGAVTNLIGHFHGVPQNGPTWGSNSSGMAMQFIEASLQYLQCASTGIVLQGGGAVRNSIVAWGRTTVPTNTPGHPLYCERATSGQDIFKLEGPNFNVASTKLVITIRNDAGTLLQAAAATTINDGTMRQLAVTKNGSAIVLYVNGTSDGTPTWSGADTYTDSLQTRIAGDPTDANAVWDGSISLVYAYAGRTLTPAEMRWLHAEPYAMLRPIVRRRYFVVTELGSPSITPSVGTTTLDSTTVDRNQDFRLTPTTA